MGHNNSMEKLSLTDGISTALHYSSPSKFIICCHGLYSSKESEKYVEMAKMAAERGVSVMRFDFRGCGESTGNMSDSTLSNRMEDLKRVIEYVRKRFGNPEIALFGSSLGGMVAIAVSAVDGKISSLAVLSTPFEIDEDLGMGKRFVEDIKRHDILEYARKAPPMLVIHGRNDELVPVEHAEKIYDNASGEKKIMFFDADHSFSVFRKEALTASLNWIEEHF